MHGYTATKSTDMRYTKKPCYNPQKQKLVHFLKRKSSNNLIKIIFKSKL